MWPEESVIKDIMSATREEMAAALHKNYTEGYVGQILSRAGEKPYKTTVSSIIAHLRMMNRSTIDFRMAKERLRVYECDHLEATYLMMTLRNMRNTRREERKEAQRQYVLDKFGCKDMDELHEKSGWIRDENGVLRPPKKERETDMPDVLRAFHTVSHRNANRVGYRGAKNEAMESALKNRRAKDGRGNSASG